MFSLQLVSLWLTSSLHPRYWVPHCLASSLILCSPRSFAWALANFSLCVCIENSASLLVEHLVWACTVSLYQCFPLWCTLLSVIQFQMLHCTVWLLCSQNMMELSAHCVQDCLVLLKLFAMHTAFCCTWLFTVHWLSACCTSKGWL